MRFQIVAVLIFSFCLMSCSPIPTEPSTDLISEMVQSSGERVLLDFALSPDGKRIAVYENTGVYIYDLDKMQKTFFIEFDESNYSRIQSGAIAFSPDGEKIAVSGKFTEAEISIWDLSSKNLVARIDELPHEYYVTEVEFDPKGKTIIVRNTNTETEKCQGEIIDKITLYIIGENKSIFEIDQCKIYPPIRFRFTADGRIFFYSGTMSNAYTVYFVDNVSGQIISREDLEWNDGNFYDVSYDRKIYLVENEGHRTYMLDSASDEVLSVVEGVIAYLLPDRNFILRENKADARWVYWEDGKFKCAYDGVRLSPDIKVSLNGKVFALTKSPTEIQVWETSTCKIISELQFDK